MDTDRVTSFVVAADAGSMSAAASRLRMPISTVSRHVADLEADLGAPLFDRTGRGVRLTAAGERFLERARQILREVDLARAAVRGEVSPELTHLRLSAPPDPSRQLLPPALLALAERHPGLSIEAHSEVRRVSLAEESYDAVVRLGPLTPSELIARPLGTISLVVCAAPGAVVRGARDLAQREFALVHGVPAELPGRERGRRVTLEPRGRLRVGSFQDAAELAARSERVALLPSLTALPWLASGRLVRVAPALTLPSRPVHLLRLARHRGSIVLADLGDLLAQGIADVEAAITTFGSA